MSTACMHIEENDGSVFVVTSSKKDQSPIIFGRVRHWTTPSNNSNEDLKSPQFFYYARSAHRMMKEMGRRGEGVNFGRGRRIPLQTFVLKGKPINYYNQTRRGLRYTTPSVQLDLEFEKPLPSHSSYSSGWESNVSMRVAFKKLFAT